MLGFGGAIALRGFNALRPFRADSGEDMRRTVLIVELLLMACRVQIAMPNRTTLPATREAGLVPIAKSLSDSSSCIEETPIFGVVPPFLWCAI